MSLKATRNILCFFLSFIIVLGGICFVGALTVNCTLVSQSYMKSILASDKILAECNDNFQKQLEALADESNIPSRVFEAVETVDDTTDLAVDRLFEGNDTTLFMESKVELFESLCKEYLDGNEIAYDEEDIHNTAVRAAEIYADSFGLKNTDEARNFIVTVQENATGIASTGLLALVLGVGMLLIMFKSKTDSAERIFSAFTAMGVTLFLAGLVSLISGFGQGAHIYPEIYSQAIDTAVIGVWIIITACGAIITGASVFASVQIYKKRVGKN
ncbi:MAG: hypothetical protein LIO62_03720 [Clostridiales bacterium]|nr:hypothetical protein [Clostridiales bacterium]